MRRILYITGTRADFGLMRRTLGTIQADPDLDLRIVTTGTHYSEQNGLTIKEVIDSGFAIAGEVRVPLFPTTGATMAKAISVQIAEFTKIMGDVKPDIVLLLGDRGEMLAGAIAALHLTIPVAHIHGGERSGTIDESVRHAISKLSHIHFVATAQSVERLRKLGERPEHIYQTGAPGLDGITEDAHLSKEALWSEFGLASDLPLALLLYHPVVQEADSGREQIEQILAAFAEAETWQVITVMPNTDAGGGSIADALKNAGSERVHCYSHLTRSQFLSFLRHADALVGNSSAGIIEAASFGIPVVNIGSRQNLRERNSNVVDIAADGGMLKSCLAHILADGRQQPHNVYGDGRASERIRDLLKSVNIDKTLLNKALTY